MRVFPQFTGPMAYWPKVEVMPHAVETLSLLHSSHILCLATNAADSSEQDIRSALQRGGINDYLDQIYCYQKIKVTKPLPEFFSYIINDHGLPTTQFVMIGDDYEADILGSLQFGMSAVWLHHNSIAHTTTEHLQIIYDLRQLPSALAQLS